MTTAVLTAAMATGLAIATAFAQQPATQRVRGVIEKVDGGTLLVKSRDGTELTLKLIGDFQVVGVMKASLADIKEGDYIGSGAMPQADGTQKAVEVHIFAPTQRGTGDGHRPWDGAPGGTMTNGEAGSPVTSVDGLTVTVKYKDGDKKLIVTPTTPIVRYVLSDKSELKPGVSINVTNAVKKPDGTFEASRINVGRDGLVL
jgi:outer membrane lipoprotein SlyB